MNALTSNDKDRLGTSGTPGRSPVFCARMHPASETRRYSGSKRVGAPFLIIPRCSSCQTETVRFDRGIVLVRRGPNTYYALGHFGPEAFFTGNSLYDWKKEKNEYESRIDEEKANRLEGDRSDRDAALAGQQDRSPSGDRALQNTLTSR